MRFRWQYQALAEPVMSPEPPEEVTSDKWAPTYPDLLLPKVGLLAAIVAGSFFAPTEVAMAEVDYDWIPETQQPLQVKKQPVQEGLSVYPFPVVKEAELLQWQQPQSLPTRRLERPFWEGLSIIDPLLITQSENILVDSWLFRVIDPIDWRYYPDSPYFLFTQSYQTPSEPPPHGKPEKDKDIPKKAWWQPQSQPVRQPLRVREGLYEPRTIEPVLSPPEVEVNLDKWYQLPNQPYILPVRLTELGGYVVDPGTYATAEEIGLDKWYSAIVQPYLTLPRLVELGWIASEPFALRYETISLDKWFVPVVQSILSAAKLTEHGWIAVDPSALRSELITIDKWESRLPTIYIPRPKWDWLYPSGQGDPYLTHIPTVTIAGIAVNDSPVYLLLSADKSLYLLDSSTGTTHRIIVNDRKRE